jgi:hypothetical protein
MSSGYFSLQTFSCACAIWPTSAIFHPRNVRYCMGWETEDATRPPLLSRWNRRIAKLQSVRASTQIIRIQKSFPVRSLIECGTQVCTKMSAPEKYRVRVWPLVGISQLSPHQRWDDIVGPLQASYQRWIKMETKIHRILQRNVDRAPVSWSRIKVGCGDAPDRRVASSALTGANADTLSHLWSAQGKHTARYVLGYGLVHSTLLESPWCQLSWVSTPDTNCVLYLYFRRTVPSGHPFCFNSADCWHAQIGLVWLFGHGDS